MGGTRFRTAFSPESSLQTGRRPQFMIKIIQCRSGGMVDAADSKSARVHALWGFDSPLRHQFSPPRPLRFQKPSRRELPGRVTLQALLPGEAWRFHRAFRANFLCGPWACPHCSAIRPEGHPQGVPLHRRAQDGESLGLPEHQAQGQRQQDGFQARSHLAPRGFAGR